MPIADVWGKAVAGIAQQYGQPSPMGPSPYDLPPVPPAVQPGGAAAMLESLNKEMRAAAPAIDVASAATGGGGGGAGIIESGALGAAAGGPLGGIAGSIVAGLGISAGLQSAQKGLLSGAFSLATDPVGVLDSLVNPGTSRHGSVKGVLDAMQADALDKHTGGGQMFNKFRWFTGPQPFFPPKQDHN